MEYSVYWVIYDYLPSVRCNRQKRASLFFVTLHIQTKRLISKIPRQIPRHAKLVSILPSNIGLGDYIDMCTSWRRDHVHLSGPVLPRRRGRKWRTYTATLRLRPI